MGLTDDEERKRLGRLLNDILSAASELHSFHLLRRKTTIDLSNASTTSGSEGIWLPGNMAGIDAVQYATTGEFLARRDYAELNNVESGRGRYTVYSPGTQPAFYCEDLRIAKGDNTFESATLDTDGTDYTGYWMQFGNEANLHLLSGERTLASRYWGETIDEGSAQIQPPTQLKIIVHDDHDTQLLTGSYIVYYWEYHPMMHRENDLCLLPNSRWIDLKMIAEAKGILGRSPRNPINREIETEWANMVRANPAFVVPNHAVDRMGRQLNPANLQYIRRNGNGDRNQTLRLDWINRSS